MRTFLKSGARGRVHLVKMVANAQVLAITADASVTKAGELNQTIIPKSSAVARTHIMGIDLRCLTRPPSGGYVDFDCYRISQ